MADQSIFRITKELSEIQKSSDLSLAVACKDVDVRNVKALIIGPPDTPYEYGLFEFSVQFSKEYPRTSPTVNGITTNGGRCRFNPNIYANGKVCLSILGTWRGESGEQWSAAQGLESILLSIQSLLSSNPYVNEPGYEDAKAASDKKYQKDYIQKIRHESLRITVVQRMEEYLGINPDGSVIMQESTDDVDNGMDGMDDFGVPWEPFRDVCKRRFLWYYDSYMTAVQTGKNEVKDGQVFTRMPFEGSSNTMDGKFNYAELEKRLRNIKRVLDGETSSWATEGQASKARETSVAVNLQRQYEQVVEHFKRTGVAHNIELDNHNPFLWIFTYIGQERNLDGGLFRIKLHFSPRFPEEQPRVKFDTKLFHLKVSPDGTPCYYTLPSKREDVRTHVQAIIEALEEEAPAYDPRTRVNPDAFKLYWGNTADKKAYRSRLRRSVQQSMEEF